MTVSLKHLFQSSTPDDPDTSLVRPSDWNAEHTLTLDSGKLLGRSSAGTGAAEEITVGSGLSLSGGTLSNSQSTTLTVGTTATSGGAAGQIMFDTGSVLQESSNLVWDNTNKKLTITGATVTTSQPVLDMTQTWNAAGTTFTGLKFNVTNTASNAASLLQDWQVGGVSQVNVGYNGTNPTLNIKSTTPTVYTIAGSAAALAFYYGGNISNTILLADFGGNRVGVTSLGLGGTGAAIGNYDVLLTRRGAANLRFGAADAAVPVAQTLSVQSVVAGTSNTAGANLTITGSQGTGTGAGGSIIFQVAPAGTTGTAQNALADALTIASNRTITTTGNAVFGNSSITAIEFIGSTGNTVAAFTNSGGTGVVNGLVLKNTSVIGFGSSVNPLGAVDVIFGRRGAANLRFGAADAAAPVAQTLSVQSVVAGTTDTAGAAFTITGSQSTGTGAAGNIIFQTSSSAASTGTAQNALATVATIGPNTLTGSQAISLLDLAQTWNTTGTPSAIKLNVTDTASNALSLLMDLQKGGVSQFKVDKNGVVTVPSSGQYAGAQYFLTSDVNNAGFYVLTNNANAGVFFGTSFDVRLRRRAAANLALGAADAAAPVAQTLSVQSVVAGTSNTAGANLTITGSQGTGTGAGGDIIFQTAAAGTTGTAQNTLTTALRIYSNQTVAVGKAYTVATLPAAGTQGRRAWVTDATAPTFLGALTGGGAVVCPVFDNGTAWVAG